MNTHELRQGNLILYSESIEKGLYKKWKAKFNKNEFWRKDLPRYLSIEDTWVRHFIGIDWGVQTDQEFDDWMNFYDKYREILKERGLI